MTASSWVLPSALSLENDRVIWAFPAPHLQERVHAGPGLLPAFVAIRTARDVLTFARRWGPLALCEHAVPPGHHPLATIPAASASCPPLLNADIGYWAPIEAWLHYARQADALLNIARQLSEGRVGKPEDWRTVLEWASYDRLQANGEARIDRESGAIHLPDHSAFEKRFETVPAERHRLAVAIGEWLDLGGVGLRFHWHDEKPKIEFGGDGLFGAVAIQLMLAIGQVDSLAQCSTCGRFYFPSRRPNPHRRNYCDRCRQVGVPQRNAARQYRERRANAPSVKEEGHGEAG